GAVILLVTAAAVAARELFCMERHGMVSFLLWFCASYYSKQLFGGFALTVTAYALPPLPKGEARALPETFSLRLML
ncbi:MAG: hypothetical protein SOV03_10485, partial [Faecalibacterium sp.]|nr:hypothetical protein [Faecalibacterium sp.]